jgi:hypothetical protein
VSFAAKTGRSHLPHAKHNEKELFPQSHCKTQSGHPHPKFHIINNPMVESCRFLMPLHFNGGPCQVIFFARNIFKFEEALPIIQEPGSISLAKQIK